MSTKSPKRRRSPNAEAAVLRACARRCALCYGLNADSNEKRGQLAHIDRQRSNSRPNNLVYLCLDHHNEYDTKYQVSKGLSPRELHAYKHELEVAIAAGIHRGRKHPVTDADHPPAPVVDHDKCIFASSDKLMSESQLTSLLAVLLDDHFYDEWQFKVLVRFCHYYSQTGNQFIGKALASRSRSLVRALAKLKSFLAFHFWLHPDEQPLDDTARYCLHPDLNFDRALRVGPVERSQYREFATQLELLVERARSAYRRYRRTVKERLFV